jgi:hypothetical protein
VLNTVFGFQVLISRVLNFQWPIQGEHGLLSICGYLRQAPVLLAFPRFGIVFSVDFTVDFAANSFSNALQSSSISSGVWGQPRRAQRATDPYIHPSYSKSSIPITVVFNVVWAL